MTVETTKRGRPAVMDEDQAARLAKTFPEVSTTRGLLNKYYELRAFRFLSRHPGIEYICDPQREKCRSGILREIGRLSGDNEDEVKKIAEAICEVQKDTPMSSRYWEKKLRGIRLDEHGGLSETVSDNARQKTLTIGLPKHTYEALEERARRTYNERTGDGGSRYDEVALYVGDLLEAFMDGRHKAQRLLYDADKITREARRCRL